MTTTELPTPNLPLLRKVLNHIDEHPEEWNQQNWMTRFSPLLNAGDTVDVGYRKVTVPACGTAFCIAGHALHMSGYEFSNYPEKNKSYWELGAKISSEALDLPGAGVGASGIATSEAAEKLLGLTPDEAFALFAASNTRSTVQHYAEMIAERAGEKL